MPSSHLSFELTDTALVERRDHRSMEYQRWKFGFLVSLHRSPALPPEFHLPDWELLNPDGSLSLLADPHLQTDLIRGRFFPETSPVSPGTPTMMERDAAAGAFQGLIADIPVDVRVAAGRLGPFQWKVLEGLSRKPELIEMIGPDRPLPDLSLPLACWAVCWNQLADPNIRETVDRAIASNRCRELLKDWFGPAGAHFATALRKVDFEVKDLIEAVGALSGIAADPRRIRICAHQTKIGWPALRYMELAPPVYLQGNVAAALSGLPDEEAEEILEVLLRADPTGSTEDDPLREFFRSVSGPESLVQGIKKLGLVRLETDFPPPPFLPHPPLEVIRTGAELAAHAEWMDHCWEDYLDGTANGDFYFYRWIGDPPLTLAIERNGPDWILHDIKGKKNADVPLSLLQTVLAHLDIFV